MNKEDIIRMAREAGILETMGYGNPHMKAWQADVVRELSHFAALVAADERERIKAANAPEIEAINAHIKALEDAVAAEREACAKICDSFQARDVGMQPAECAGAIRARGNQ